MLGNCEVLPHVPTKNLDRAKRFYEDTLGLEYVRTTPDGGVVLRAGGGTQINLYATDQSGPNGHTLASFVVDDVDDEVRELRSRGVQFEQFELGDATWRDGIASLGEERAAWFKDPDGNFLCIFKPARAHAMA